MTIFLTTSKEGKPTKNNVKDYFAKVIHPDVMTCPIALESCLIVFRHDIIGIGAPEFKDAKGNGSRSNVSRPWYDDKWLATLRERSGESSTKSPVLKPLKMNSLYQSWSKTFKELGIASMHVAHIPRVVQTFMLGLQGFSHDESGILGKWRSYSDAQSLSYEKLPDGGILSRVTGFEDLQSFRPYWFQLEPPECLLSKVLPMFQTELKKAQRRVELARLCEDAYVARLLHDSQCVETCTYLCTLAKVFLCASPFLRSTRNDHPLFQCHPVFKESAFERWSQIVKSHVTIMNTLESNAIKGLLGLLGSTTFTVVESSSRVDVVARGDSNGSTELHQHARRLTDLANDTEETQISDQVERHPLEASEREISNAQSLQFSLEIRALKDENARLKRVISCFLTGQHQEASNLLDLPQYILGHQQTEILESKVVTSTAQLEHLEPPRKKPRHTQNERLAHVRHLMPLSAMTMQDLLEIWNQQWGHLGKQMKPLREIVDAPLDNGTKKWANKGIAEQVKRMRAIITLLELLELHDIAEPAKKVEELRHKETWSMDGLGRRIQLDFRHLKVSSSGKATTASDVFNHPNYNPNECLWKDLV